MEKFTWGIVIEELTIRQYTIVEYHPWKRDSCTILTGKPDFEKKCYSTYLNGKDTCIEYDSLQSALVGLIAQEADGPNTKADLYFMKMISN